MHTAFLYDTIDTTTAGMLLNKDARTRFPTDNGTEYR